MYPPSAFSVRLLHQGLQTLSGFETIANKFPFETFSHSPLADQSSEKEWSVQEKSGICFLERQENRLPGPLYVAGKSSSVLDIAKELYRRDCFPEWSSVLAVSQSAGRGQMRRTWISPEGNLYVALRLPEYEPFSTTAAAPATGALCAEALTNSGFSVRQKWPNDILQPFQKNPGAAPGNDQESFRKVAGILLEETKGMLVAGMGFNIASCPSEAMLRSDHAFPAGRLCPSVPGKKITGSGTGNDKIVNIFSLWVQLAADMFSCYNRMKTQDEWWVSLTNVHLAFLGEFVSLADAVPESALPCKKTAEGTIKGITRSGALLISTFHGTESFLGGSLLPSRQ